MVKLLQEAAAGKVVFKVTVCPSCIITFSEAVGTALANQVAGVFQFPLAAVTEAKLVFGAQIDQLFTKPANGIEVLLACMAVVVPEPVDNNPGATNPVLKHIEVVEVIEGKTDILP
jgi:hypothetical protein